VPDDLIAKRSWASFCDRISPVLEGKRAEVEVASLGLGEQIATEWAPLVGVSYDEKDDVFSIAVGGLGHLIRHPQTLAVQWRGPAVESLAVTDRAGRLHIVRFREPLLLPPPPL
jgi:hypothetical protein